MKSLTIFLVLLLSVAYMQSDETSYTLYNQDGYVIDVAYEHDFLGWEQASFPNANVKVHFMGSFAQKLNNGQVASLIWFRTDASFNVANNNPGFIQQFGCLGLNNNCPYNTMMQSYFFASRAKVNGAGAISFAGSSVELSSANMGAADFDDSLSPDTRYAWTDAQFLQSNMPRTDAASSYRCYFKTGQTFNTDVFPRLDIKIDSTWSSATFSSS